MKRFLILFPVIFFLYSCTRNFKEMNTDKTGITEEDMKIDLNHIGIPMSIIQQGIYFNYDFGKGKNWPYQIMQNLSADLFSGYMHDYKPLNGGSHNSDYNLQDSWNSTMWENTYAYIMPQVKKLEDSTRTDYPQFYGITKILKVLLMHRITDYYGPVIYTHFGEKGNENITDSQPETYEHFFEDLDTAVNCISHYLQLHPSPRGFESFDLLSDGQFSSWLKLANSLRLRLAVRIAMAAPGKAAEEARKALSDPYGVLEKSYEIIAVSTSKEYTNPLGEINKSWGEVYMNANMESILNGYQDSRREVFFHPSPEDILYNGDTIRLKGKYKGIRQGTCFAHNRYRTHSSITVTPATDAILMTAAEIWFLRAEAALRGWTAEEAGDCYRQGVAVSFQQWGANIGDYLQTERFACDYEDAFEPDFNIKARCKVSPLWSEEDEPEVKLEKIITQKWLALFPEGCEAWAEQRRTGYPRLFPVKYNNSPDHCIDTERMIRRLNFPAKLQDTDPGLYRALQQSLGAPDHAGTPLWWDTGKNF